MDQFIVASNTLLSAALSVFSAFLYFLVQILNFLLLFVQTILSALHLQ